MMPQEWEVEVELKVTKTYSTTIIVRSTDMDDMTEPELIAEYYNKDEVELTEDEDYKVEIEDYQYTTTAY